MKFTCKPYLPITDANYRRSVSRLLRLATLWIPVDRNGLPEVTPCRSSLSGNKHPICERNWRFLGHPFQLPYSQLCHRYVWQATAFSHLSIVWGSLFLAISCLHSLFCLSLSVLVLYCHAKLPLRTWESQVGKKLLQSTLCSAEYWWRLYLLTFAERFFLSIWSNAWRRPCFRLIEMWFESHLVNDRSDGRFLEFRKFASPG